VFTTEFMRDLGLTGIEDTLTYSTNTETSLDYTEITQSGFGSTDLRNTTRTRGLSAATTLRDLFSTSLRTDAYNTERLTLASGPNSMLFGVGNAGGVIDTTTVRAHFRRHAGTVQFRTDHNRSERAALDYNRVLVPGRLAARLALLREHANLDRAPAYDNNDNVFLTATWQPLAATTVRVSYEWQRQIASRATGRLPDDFVSPWIDAGRPLFNNRAGLAIGNAALTTANIVGGRPGLTNADVVGLFATSTSASPVWIHGNTALPPSVRVFNRAVTTKGPHQAAGVSTLDNYIRSLNRPDIHPLDVSLLGTKRVNDARPEGGNIVVEQGLFDRRLSLQFGYAREYYPNLATSWGDLTEIRADPNVYLADGVTPNPNAGRLYVQSFNSDGRILNNNDEWRATAVLHHDFVRHSGWLRWLGRHTLAALVSGATERSWRNEYNHVVVGGTPSFLTPPTTPVVVNGVTVGLSERDNASRQFNTRYYLGPGNLAPENPFPGYGLFDAIPLTDPANGASYTVAGHRQAPGLWNQYQTNTTSNRSLVSTLQSYWWRDRIVTFAGWREDTVRSANAGSLPGAFTNPMPNGFFPVTNGRVFQGYSRTEVGRTFNWGVVLHPLPWLSFHYNDSENFKPAAQSYDAWGQLIQGESGVGEDYGFSLSFGTAFNLRVNRYTNSQEHNRPSNDLNALRRPLTRLETRVRDILGTAYRPNGFDPNVLNENSVLVQRDYVAEGYDIEATANLGRGWTMRATVGRQRTQESNVGSDWIAWTAARLPIWQAAGRGWTSELFNPANPAQGTIKDRYDIDFLGTALPLWSAREGAIRDNQREWRSSAVVTYRFAQERLKGLRLTGAYRWQSSATIGYLSRTLPTGQLVYDLGKPVRTGENLYFDAGAGYSFRTPQKWGGQRVSLAVNVRNLLDEDDPIVLRALTTGAPSRYGYQQPRQVQFTTEVEF